MKSGRLFFNQSGRYQLGDWELHCGDCFQVWDKGQWLDVRIEHQSDGWYLVGAEKLNLDGALARTY